MTRKKEPNSGQPTRSTNSGQPTRSTNSGQPTRSTNSTTKVSAENKTDKKPSSATIHVDLNSRNIKGKATVNNQNEGGDIIHVYEGKIYVNGIGVNLEDKLRNLKLSDNNNSNKNLNKKDAKLSPDDNALKPSSKSGNKQGEDKGRLIERGPMRKSDEPRDWKPYTTTMIYTARNNQSVGITAVRCPPAKDNLTINNIFPNNREHNVEEKHDGLEEVIDIMFSRDEKIAVFDALKYADEENDNHGIEVPYPLWSHQDNNFNAPYPVEAYPLLPSSIRDINENSGDDSGDSVLSPYSTISPSPSSSQVVPELNRPCRFPSDRSNSSSGVTGSTGSPSSCISLSPVPQAAISPFPYGCSSEICYGLPPNMETPQVLTNSVPSYLSSGQTNIQPYNNYSNNISYPPNSEQGFYPPPQKHHTNIPYHSDTVYPVPQAQLLLPRPVIPKVVKESGVERLLKKMDENSKDDAWAQIFSMRDINSLVDGDDKDGDTRLMILACNWKDRKRYYALLYALVERIKNIPSALTRANNSGHTALFLASVFSNQEPLVARFIAEVIIKKKENVNQIDIFGNSILHAICTKGDSHVHVMAELLALRDENNEPYFKVNHQNTDGATPLHIAVMFDGYNGKKCIELVGLLLQEGANILVKRQRDEATPLHLAVMMGCRPLLIEMLLSTNPVSSSAVIQGDVNQNTPLHLAVTRALPWDRQRQVIQMLLEYGAQYRIWTRQNKDGKTPLALVPPEKKEKVRLIFNKYK